MAFEFLGALYPGKARHPDIHQDDVWRGEWNTPHRLVTIRIIFQRPVLIFRHLGHSGTNSFVVVNQRNTDRESAVSFCRFKAGKSLGSQGNVIVLVASHTDHYDVMSSGFLLLLLNTLHFLLLLLLNMPARTGGSDHYFHSQGTFHNIRRLHLTPLTSRVAPIWFSIHPLSAVT